MKEFTGYKGKSKQMSGELMPAAVQMFNIGQLVGKERFPKGTKCLICGDPMVSAEHLISKSNGGNHTKHNVIPVCKAHEKACHWTKPWRDGYNPEEITIIENFTGDDSLKLNPYFATIKPIVEAHRAKIDNAINKLQDEMFEEVKDAINSSSY